MSIMKIARIDVARALKNPKTLIIVLLGFFFLSSNMDVAIDMAAEYELGIPPFLYPIFLSEWRGRMYALVLLVVLMSEAPFYNGSEVFTIMRVSRYKWITAKLGYILIISGMFQIAMFILSILVCGTNIGLGTEWGDVIITYMNSIQGMISAEGVVDSGGILSMSPMTALLYELILMFLLSIIIGLLTLILNGVLKSIAGTVIVGVSVLADIYLTDLAMHGIADMTYALPTTWVDLNCFSAGVGLTFEKCVIYMLIIIAVLVAISYILVGKRIIQPVKNV